MDKDIIEVSLDDVLTGKCRARSSILDSKLISATISDTPMSFYDIKLIECGNYIQVYYYENGKAKKKKTDDLDLIEKKNKIDKLFENTSSSKPKTLLSEKIEERNLIRSKLECQRLAKANINDWETFITLTFADNVTDVAQANKRFKYFIDKIRKRKKDLKYLCVTEFQKRGATHYHLLSNIDIDDKDLIYAQEDNPKFKHIKYWIDGYTSVEKMQGDPKKIIGYIAKYMTKDINNRLFNHRRYFYSQNLQRPIENYINLENEKELEFYQKKIQDNELIYQNDYTNPYDDSNVSFLEYIKK